MEKKGFYADVFHYYASNNDMQPTPTASRPKPLFANVRIFPASFICILSCKIVVILGKN